MSNTKDLKIVLSAVDNASKEINQVNSTLNEVANFAKKAAIAIGVVAGGFGYVLKETTDASNELNNSLIGLNSVARAFGQDTDKAKQAAQDLAKDGLMSVSEAAAGLKNLLASKFNLPEAINLMNAFKDSASFNRQASLGFGESIRGATEGIKNQNSILVDNAGITKNLSIILKEAGYSQQDLQNVTSDSGVRLALYNGILKEASIFQGDAARAAETLAGKQAALATQIFTTKAAIGEQLTPIMTELVSKTSQVVAIVGKLVEEVKTAGGISIFFKEKLTELMNYIDQRLGLITILKNSWNNVALVFREQLLPELKKLWEALQPLMPFIELLAKIIGVILFGAIIAVVKLIEVGLIVSIAFLTKTVEIANNTIKLFGSFWDGIISTISSVVSWVDKLITSLSRLNVVSAAKNAVSSMLGFGGARAEGGPVSSNTAYLVGERGPELFVPSAGGSITPNHALGGSNISITITGNTLLDSRAGEKIGNLIINRLALNARLA